MKQLSALLYAITLPLLLIGLWWVLTLGSTNVFVPTPPELAQTFVEVWIGPRFVQDVVPSVSRLIVGLAIAIVLGIALGALIGSFRTLREFTEPVLEFFRALPPPVLIPVMMLLIGINDTMKIVVIVSGSIWPILLNTIEGVRGIDSIALDTGRSYRILGSARLRHVVLPAALPKIFAGIRQALSIGIILMVVSEMFASTEGLGFTIVQFQRTFAIPEMWSGVLLLALIGLLLSTVFQLVERSALRWYFGLKEVENAG